MEIAKPYEGIYIISDMFKKKYIDSLLEYAKTITEEEWRADSIKSSTTNYWKDKYFDTASRLNDPFEKFIYPSLFKINWQVAKIFSNYTNFSLFKALQRSSDIHSSGLAVHADNGHESHSDIKYGLVIYLNDDFKGGELFYPELDIEYKPVAGDMVVHKGSIPHGTRRVEVGNRYFLTAFIHGDNNTKFLLGDNDE